MCSTTRSSQVHNILPQVVPLSRSFLTSLSYNHSPVTALPETPPLSMQVVSHPLEPGGGSMPPSTLVQYRSMWTMPTPSNTMLSFQARSTTRLVRIHNILPLNGTSIPTRFTTRAMHSFTRASPSQVSTWVMRGPVRSERSLKALRLDTRCVRRTALTH